MILKDLIVSLLGAHPTSDVVIRVDIDVADDDARTYRLEIDEVDTHTFGVVTIKAKEVEI